MRNPFKIIPKKPITAQDIHLGQVIKIDHDPNFYLVLIIGAKIMNDGTFFPAMDNAILCLVNDAYKVFNMKLTDY